MAPLPSTAVMRRRLGLLAAVLVAVAGCGGESHPAARNQASPTPTASAESAAPASAAGQECGESGVRAQPIRFRTSDGVRLSGAVVGSGPVGAVLIHEWPRDYCGWLPYAGYLSRHGVRALAFDLRCFGRSACPDGGRGRATTDVAAAMAELRRQGARRVALVGASMGGTIAVVAAGRHDRSVYPPPRRESTGIERGLRTPSPARTGSPGRPSGGAARVTA